MIQTLIVDDEELLRKGLIASMDWEALGFEIAGEALNGCEAQAFIESHPINLVISDIRMPLMDGVELMKSTMSRGKEIEFVILSGHDDFAYAQSAIRYGAASYVLKPFDIEEMEAELLKVKSKLETKAEGERIKNDLRTVARESFLKKLLENEITEEEYAADVRNIDVRFENEDFQVVVFQIDPSKTSVAENVYIKDISDIFLENCSGEVLVDRSFGESSRLILIANGWKGIEGLDGFLETLRSSFCDDIGYSIGIGDKIKGAANVSCSYREANEALAYKLAYGSRTEVYYKDIKKFSGTFGTYPLNLELKLFEAINQENVDAVKLAVDEFFKSLCCSPVINLRSVKQSVYELLVSFKHRYYFNTKDFSLYQPFSALDDLNNLDDIHTYTTAIFLEHFPNQADDNHKRSRKLIDDVKRYVDSNYLNKITLEDISTKFFISKSHFCRTFKDMAGLNFYQYLNFVRIEKAKLLLKNSYYKNYEISEKIGFENTSYFNHLFKKMTGMTPYEYRENA
jgi:Response regulator containing CheY-like receiver domain and AraC-type DNA-binding domain